ncbi:hypothetical protein AVEN_163679-1 [Araneus ventricosus]|uniref:Uncharacterized protein n=1 Tax=Araneus ventricosus TaxID=182803 RepID=A0A4Y2LVB4_ARAVE|nr:hypothetical protein AVEN_163679-1 [Araneus ventricosus]
MNDPIVMLLGPIDPRVVKYPLLSSLLPTVFFSTIFLIFIKLIGPALMRNREPYNLRHVMVVFNIFLVGVNGWITFTVRFYFTSLLLTRFLVCLFGTNFATDFKLTSR